MTIVKRAPGVAVLCAVPVVYFAQEERARSPRIVTFALP